MCLRWCFILPASHIPLAEIIILGVSIKFMALDSSLVTAILSPLKVIGFMYSSEDLERFYFQYQTEALPHGESLQSFCVKNKVPYNIFQKWYRDTRKKVVEVQVDGAPVIGHEEQSGAIDQPQPVSPGRTDHPVRIWVEIRISNGLHLFQKNLSYPDLVRMVEKLEGLC